MGIANSQGSQTATINTDHSLAAFAVAGTYICTVDTTNMADGDVLELHVKEIINTSGSQRDEWQTYYDAQPSGWRVKRSLPFTISLTDTGALEFTLKQTKGTGRAFPWKVEQITP